jgi:hypothetical protein
MIGVVDTESWAEGLSVGLRVHFALVILGCKRPLPGGRFHALVPAPWPGSRMGAAWWQGAIFEIQSERATNTYREMCDCVALIVSTL